VKWKGWRSVIPEIGLMVGLYVITRIVQLLLTTSAHGSGVERFTKLLALLTMLVTGFVMFDLVVRGTVGIGIKDIPELTK
jgi:hypothetical protein